MASDDAPAKVARWRDWIHGDIRDNVVGMYFRRQMWREVNEMLQASPVAQIPSAFWDFYHENYAAAQAIAIRRQADKTRGTRSLLKLIQEIYGNPALLTREGYVALLDEFQAKDDLLVLRANQDWDLWADPEGQIFDRRIAKADIDQLEADAERVKVYVDDHLAHHAERPKGADLPTLKDLHETIDAVGAIDRKSV